MSGSQNNIFEIMDLDDETLEDFMLSLYEGLELVEHDLVSLERNPNDEKAINSLFRAIHSLKGNCRMCFIDPCTNYVHGIEEAIADIRSKRIQFTPLIKEALLLGFDLLRISCETLAQVHKLETTQLENVAVHFHNFTTATPLDVEVEAAAIIKMIGGEAVESVPITGKQIPAIPEVTKEGASETNDDDLIFFRTMSCMVDRKSPYWDKRTSTLVEFALETNQRLQNPVDEKQLRAAIYLHDLGMMFINEDIINKAQKLNPLEEKELKSHTKIGYEWLSRIPGWQDAAAMVLEHHERPDGRGYPYGKKEGDIHIGAQIIAVADTYFSVTNERADRTYKRSLLRAITEINSYAGTQFSTEVVEAFNDLIRNNYTSKASKAANG